MGSCVPVSPEDAAGLMGPVGSHVSLEAQPLSEPDRITYVISISYDELRMPTLDHRRCHLRWEIKSPLGYACQ
jgi:hypothetical protein